MSIFLRELRTNLKPLILWSVGMILLVLTGMADYSALSSTALSGSLIKDIPASIRALFGFGSFDVTKMSGYFAFLFLYLEITVAFHGVTLGAGIIAKEERLGTAEFLVTKPISRSGILTAKLCAALMNITVLNLVTLASSLVIVPLYNKNASITAEILRLMVSMFFVQLLFLAIGAVFAAVIKNNGHASAIASWFVVFAYAIYVATNLNDGIRFLNILSPFKYFDTASIANGKGLDSLMAMLSLLLVVICSGIAYYAYERRDIHS
ncbi:MAG: ABC transporter permease subunit [Coriobacteriia bacterium]|nr:ABC transporter permease subunit [Coriobacteriia bacterium]